MAAAGRQFFFGVPLKAGAPTAKQMDPLLSPSEYSETGHNDDLSTFTDRENENEYDERVICSCCGLFRIILKVFLK